MTIGKHDIKSRLTGYDIDTMFWRVNEIYERMDEGYISFNEANEQLIFACQAYLIFNNPEEDDDE